MGNFRSGFMTIIGRPNVGKSTLMNYLVGQKIAIVSDKPQTTRNRIRGVVTGPDYQLFFWIHRASISLSTGWGTTWLKWL